MLYKKWSLQLWYSLHNVWPLHTIFINIHYGLTLVFISKKSLSTISPPWQSFLLVMQVMNTHTYNHFIATFTKYHEMISKLWHTILNGTFSYQHIKCNEIPLITIYAYQNKNHSNNVVKYLCQHLHFHSLNASLNWFKNTIMLNHDI